MPRHTLALAASFFIAPVAQAAAPPAPRELPYSECLQIDRINEWNVVNDTTVTVRNGPNYFLVKTQVAC